MPQHLWRRFSNVRACEVCLASQAEAAGEWAPTVSFICPGDPDDDGPRGKPRGRPLAPSGALRVRELATEGAA